MLTLNLSCCLFLVVELVSAETIAICDKEIHCKQISQEAEGTLYSNYDPMRERTRERL